MGDTLTTSAPVAEKKGRRREKVAVIDTDIHNYLPMIETLYKYLPQRWQRHHQLVGLRGHFGSAYPRALPNASRHDSWPPSGGPPGSDLGFMQEQLLDAWDIEYGILNPLRPFAQVNLEYGGALASALNEWQIEAWLDLEPRLRASIYVQYEDGDLAAAEIDRLGDHPGFVQVLMLVRTNEPLGRRKYWKIYEAAARHDLPIGIHFGGAGGSTFSAAGWPSHYIEDHGGMPQAFQTQVASLVCEGVFERYPTLKVALIEGGFAWLPPLMWRLDRSWKKLRDEVADLKRPPSEYIREHFWVSTQPMEEPPKGEYFDELLDQLDMDDRLMFATDYPHWDFDSPERAFPIELGPELKTKIMAENARNLYRF